MVDVTEKIMGPNGNGGRYYRTLPKGNEIFKYSDVIFAEAKPGQIRNKTLQGEPPKTVGEALCRPDVMNAWWHQALREETRQKLKKFMKGHPAGIEAHLKQLGVNPRIYYTLAAPFKPGDDKGNISKGVSHKLLGAAELLDEPLDWDAVEISRR